MKRLVIGDPHTRPSNLEESHRVMEMAEALAKDHKVDRIEILGDLLHTHAVIRLEAQEFWTEWLFRLSHADYPKDIVVLVGNHDLSGDHNSKSNALSVFTRMDCHGLLIVEQPESRGIYAYSPYMHDPTNFLAQANLLSRHGAKVLVCHQTIAGAQYENSFYAPDGIDPNLIPFDLIFSGHIHKAQILKSGEKTVIYPGTPLWSSASDINEDKGIWLYTHDDQGKLLNSEFFSTAKVCKPMIGISWTQGEEMPKLPEGEVNLHIELIGSSDWIKEQKERFQGKAAIKSRITDSRPVRMKSGANFEHFFNNVFQTELDKAELLKFMRGEGLV